jgi:hypothetical protein
VHLTVPIINFAFETIIFDYKNNYNSNNSKIENQDNNKNNKKTPEKLNHTSLPIAKIMLHSKKIKTNLPSSVE